MIPPGHWGMQTPGFAGSWMSHQAVLLDTPVGKSVLVFEDDALPDENFKNTFTWFWKDLPADWEGIWLGWDPNHHNREHVTDHVVRHLNPLNTHAYAVRGALLAAAVREEPQNWGRSHWDGMLQRRAREFRVYSHHSGRLVRQSVWDGQEDLKDNYEDTRDGR